jgi:hypothetical protein
MGTPGHDQLSTRTHAKTTPVALFLFWFRGIVFVFVGRKHFLSRMWAAGSTTTATFPPCYGSKPARETGATWAATTTCEREEKFFLKRFFR